MTTDESIGATQRARLPAIVGLSLVAWAALIAAATLRGNPMREVIKLQAPPLIASVDHHVQASTWLVLALGLALAGLVPRLCGRLGWRRVLVLTVLVALGWGLALASIRGADRLEAGLEGPYEYPAVVVQVDEVGVRQFIDTFTDPDVLAAYPVHVEGHPIGSALLFVGLDRIGLGGLGPAAALMILAGAATVPAVLLAVREVADEGRARQAAPFVAMAPALIWMVTSADALFTSVAAWAIALLVLATSSDRSLRRREVLAVAGGAVFGLGLHLSYGLAPLILVPVFVIVLRRRWDVLAWAALGGGVVTGVFTVAGFWWFDGLAATRVRYGVGIARLRPYSYFVPLGNPAAFAVTLGPAVAVAIATVRDRRLWILTGAMLATVLVANLSGLSKGEVDRIWLPFVPWVVLLCGGLADVGRSRPIALRRGAPGTAHVDDPGGSEPVGGASDRPDLGELAIDGPAPVTMRWSTLAGAMLVLQVIAAVTIESLILTPW